MVVWAWLCAAFVFVDIVGLFGGPLTVWWVRRRVRIDVWFLAARDAAPAAPRPPAASVAALGGGHGIVGMRERVIMLGGGLETGPTDDGGFQVRATIPLRRGEEGR
jgi:hypothetical protein